MPSTCPFADGTPEAVLWERGWRDGSEQTLKRTLRWLAHG